MSSYPTITFRSICAIAMLFCFSVLAAPEKQGGRFLFLVETSSAMDGNKTALRKTLRSIIESGLNDQMQYGDTMGLWTYNDVLNPSFPMITYHRDQAPDIINAVEFFMSKQKFVHRGEFSKVMPVLQNIIKPSQKLTIVWISSGNDKITGTPFDASIEELHKEFRDDFRKQHIPFVTLLVVRKGAIVDFTVNPGDSRLRLPAIIEKEAAEAKEAASKAPPAESPVAQPSTKKPSLVIKVGPSPEVVEQKKAAEAAKTQTNVPAPVATPQTNTNLAVAAPVTAPTNTAAVVTNKPAAIINTAAAAPVQTNAVVGSNLPAPAVASPPVAVVPKSAAVVTNPPAPAPATNVSSVSNIPAVATPVAKSQPPQQPTTTPTVAVATSSSLWIAIGAGALVLFAGIVFLVMKQASAPKGPSFISQSMTRERFNPDASKPSSDNPADHG